MSRALFYFGNFSIFGVMKYPVFIFLLFISCISVAQNRNSDSLLNLLRTDKEDTNKVKHLNALSRQFRQRGDYTPAMQYANQALAICDKLSLPSTNQQNKASMIQRGRATAYNNIGAVNQLQGNYPEALKGYFASLKIWEEILSTSSGGGVRVGAKKGIANSHNNIGIIYRHLGNLPEALGEYFVALKIREEIGDKQDIAASYNNIGIIYDDQDNYPEAIKVYLAALKIREEIGDKKDIANSHSNIGVTYKKQAMRERSPLKREQLYADALKEYLVSLKIKEEIGDKEGLAISYVNIGAINMNRKKLAEAKKYFEDGLNLSKEIGYKDAIKEAYEALSVLDSTAGNYKEAFMHHKLFVIYRDSLDNEEAQKKSLQSTMQYEFDKKEIAAKAAQDKLDAITAEEKQKQQIVIYAVAGVLFLVIVFSIFLFNRFRITNRQKVIIEKQKQQVDKAYESLHEKNKEVMDSIHYAHRIQRALITSEKYISNQLNRLMRHN